MNHGLSAVVGTCIRDESWSEYLFENGTAYRGPSSFVQSVAAEDLALDVDAVPVVAIGTRCWQRDGGDVCFVLFPTEPRFEVAGGGFNVLRMKREVTVHHNSFLCWRLIELLDGSRSVKEIVKSLGRNCESALDRLLCTLVYSGAVDVSGSAIRNFIHSACKRGVIPDGKLAHAQVTDLLRQHRTPAHSLRPNVSIDAADARLEAFWKITRNRRSPRSFSGQMIDHLDLEKILTTACGETGFALRDNQKLPLRAYPSPGALYAIRILMIAERVNGLRPGVYEYSSHDDSISEISSLGKECDGCLSLVLPDQRAALDGVGAVICLVASFERIERKYGQGSYRSMALEAGHISQNLALAATCLGLGARPIDSLIEHKTNDTLGLIGVHDQFVLSVWIGHSL